MQFQPDDIIIIAVSILLSMGLHEAMHAFTAHWLGDTTARDMGRLTLNPLAHVDLYTTVLLPIVLILLHMPPIFAAKPVPFNPARVRHDEFGAALIGLAGPLTNLVLAIAAAGILRILGFDSGLGEALFIFIEVNLGFFIFNLIPFPPLDGSRVVYAFAPEPIQRAMYQIESLGIWSIVIFFILLVPVIGPVMSFANQRILMLLLG